MIAPMVPNSRASRASPNVWKEFDVKSYAFLFWAYNIVWAAIAGYLLLTFLKVRKLDRRLDLLERRSRGND